MNNNNNNSGLPPRLLALHQVSQRCLRPGNARMQTERLVSTSTWTMHWEMVDWSRPLLHISCPLPKSAVLKIELESSREKAFWRRHHRCAWSIREVGQERAVRKCRKRRTAEHSPTESCQRSEQLVRKRILARLAGSLPGDNCDGVDHQDDNHHLDLSQMIIVMVLMTKMMVIIRISPRW